MSIITESKNVPKPIDKYNSQLTKSRQNNGKNWDEYETVQTALRKLRKISHTSTLSKPTFMSLKCWLTRYVEYTKMNPDELIREGMHDAEMAEDRLSEYFGKLVSHELTYKSKIGNKDGKIAFNTAISAVYGSLRGFYTKNNVNTICWVTPKKHVPKCDATDADTPMFLEVDGDLDLNRELLMKYFKTLSFRDEMIAMCLMSSGVDISDILRLNIEDVKYQSQNRIFMSFTRTKTGESGKTFFSIETTNKLRKFLNDYRNQAKDKDGLFVTSKNNRLSPSMVAHAFKQAQRRIGIKRGERELSPIRSKRLRKIFKSAGTRAGIDEDMIRVFMGQSSHQSKKYLGKSREELEFYYKKIEPFVTMTVTKPFEDELKRKDAEIERLRGLLEDQNVNESLLSKFVSNPQFQTILNAAIAKELKKD